MPVFGFSLSSEEHAPAALIRQAVLAEEAGFGGLTISDHYHPWVPAQGHSPFVWTVLGGIANATQRIPVMTGVTCPTIRVHPAIIAQAAATTADLFDGRFTLGVGSGEALNEHVLGDSWPAPEVRHDMLREAIDVIRLLWDGEEVDFEGAHYIVRSARLFTLPSQPIPVIVAAGGTKSAELAAENDGVITTAPDREVIRAFRENGGGEKPCAALIHLSYAASAAEAREQVVKYWPTSALSADLHTDIPTPALYEQVIQSADKETVASAVPSGTTANDFIEPVREYVDAGFSHIYIGSVGPRYEDFFRFWKSELGPALASEFGN